MVAIAVLGPIAAGCLMAALFTWYRSIGSADKLVFGCGIAAWAIGVLAATALAVRGRPRWPGVLLLLFDVCVAVAVLLLAVVAASPHS